MLWLATGFYTVRPNEVGINMIFGSYTGTTGEGLRYNLPYPIGRVIKPNVTRPATDPKSATAPGAQGRARDVLEESLMLTGDENIVDIDFDVQWQVNPARAQDFVFNLQNPEGTIKAVAESAMREVIGRRNIQAVLTTEQAQRRPGSARTSCSRRSTPTAPASSSRSCSCRPCSRRRRCARPSST